MSSGTNAGTAHQPHYHTTMHHAAPPIPRRFPPRQAPYPILISPSFLACSEYLPSAIPMPLGPINQIAITTGPRSTHGGYSPPALHQPANHPQTNNSAYPRALKRGGRRRPTRPPRPQLLPETHPPVLKPLNLDSSLYSTPRSQTPKLRYRPSSS